MKKTAAELRALAARLAGPQGLEIKNRRYHLKRYTDCFAGSSAGGRHAAAATRGAAAFAQRRGWPCSLAFSRSGMADRAQRQAPAPSNARVVPPRELARLTASRARWRRGDEEGGGRGYPAANAQRGAHQARVQGLNGAVPKQVSLSRRGDDGRRNSRAERRGCTWCGGHRRGGDGRRVAAAAGRRWLACG
jgi:hypothetical protein